MSKRITYLQRRADLSAAAFSEHWRRAHAEIAVDLPGAVGYRQNHVLPGTAGDAAGAPFTVNGIVELWFTSADIAHAGISSAVSDRLVEDEPRFLSGLTGAPVAASGPAPLTSYALWLLGWGGPVTPPSSTVEIAEALAGLPGAGPVTVNELEPSGAHLVRSDLQQMPALPGCAVSAGFESREEVGQAELDLGRHLVGSGSAFARVQLLTAEVISIIEPPL